MSLTSHLRDPNSPIGQFIRQQCSQSPRITRVANPQLRRTETVNPGFESRVYSHLGRAIDYRIRYYFALTPKERLIAWFGATALAVKPWEDEHDIPFNWNDVPEGMSILLLNIGEHPTEPALGPYPLPLLLSFFDSLDATLRTMQPVRRRLEPEEERLLARYCFVLGLFEEPYRSGRYAEELLMMPAPRKSVDELLAIPEDAWIDDLCTLSTLFYDNYHPLLSLPFTLNPTFAGSSDVGGADADIIIDGCLIEIKSSIRPRIDSSWLHQLVGYALLDYADQHHLHSVGIHMTRQGLLLTWSLIDVLRLLTGNDQISLTQLRQNFRMLCQQQRPGRRR